MIFNTYSFRLKLRCLLSTTRFLIDFDSLWSAMNVVVAWSASRNRTLENEIHHFYYPMLQCNKNIKWMINKANNIIDSSIFSTRKIVKVWVNTPQSVSMVRKWKVWIWYIFHTSVVFHWQFRYPGLLINTFSMCSWCIKSNLKFQLIHTSYIHFWAFWVYWKSELISLTKIFIIHVGDYDFKIHPHV